MDTVLQDVLKRASKWPREAQQELADIALELEAAVELRAYAASAEELEAIDEGDKSGVATEDEVRSAFAAFRRG